jgi:hypothetical protein
MSDIIYVVLLIIGALLIYFRPLAKATQISIYWEIGVGSLAIVMNTYVVQKEVEEGLAKQPCGPSSPQGMCYNLDRDVCEMAWNNVDAGCKAEAEPVLKERPGALIGPIINRCKARRMDKGFRYNRIKANTVVCRAYFNLIDEP